jgi:hypothetical protein
MTRPRRRGFTGRSPGFLVAVTRLLGLRAGASSPVRLVALTDSGSRRFRSRWPGR